MNIPTPHIEATDIDNIAKTVLMPGDPLRAKLIADNFLTDTIQFNTVRNMLGYTGYYKGKKLSVMGSGMGIASIGIYSYELYAFYKVDNIIRIGSAGSYDKDLNVYDVVLAKDAWSESTYAQAQSNDNSSILEPSAQLNNQLRAAAVRQKIELKEARVHSTDVFYRQIPEIYKEIHSKHGCLCVEMEAFGLFANAKVLNKQAACVLTISDSFITQEAASSEKRQNSFTKMIKLVLEAV